MNAICIKSVENDGKNFIKGHKYDFTFKFDSLDHRPPYTEYNYAGILFYDQFTAKAENKLCFDDYFKIDDPSIMSCTQMEDLKDFVDKALNSTVNPFAVRARLEENYKKKVLGVKLSAQFDKVMKMGDRPIMPCTWRKDKGACILSEARLIRWLKTEDYGETKTMITILRPGDMYVENTDYIPLAELLLLPSTD